MIGIELADIFNLLLEVSSIWRNIGILLRIEPNRLQGIASECSNNPDNCLREMITHWMSRGNPSLAELSKALRQLNCHETLQKLKKKYVQETLDATQQGKMNCHTMGQQVSLTYAKVHKFIVVNTHVNIRVTEVGYGGTVTKVNKQRKRKSTEFQVL